MTDRTVFTFDHPDERQFEIPRLLPMLRRDDSIEIAGESHIVRSASLVVNIETNEVTLYVRLRG